MLSNDSVAARDLLLAEFSSLRAESAAAKQNQQSVFQWSLAAIGGVWVGTMALSPSHFATFISLAVVIPVLSTAGFGAWIGEVHRMERAGRFLRARELAFNLQPLVSYESALAPSSLPIMWESLIYDDGNRNTFGKDRIGPLSAIFLFGTAFFGASFGADLTLHSVSFGPRGLAAGIRVLFDIWLWATPFLFLLVFIPPLHKLRASSHGRLPRPTSARLAPAETTDLVLPCFNEAAALPWIASRIPENVNVILVDNNSTDGSAELAKALGFTVVFAAYRGQIGAVSKLGIDATSSGFVCVMDCDGTVDPADLKVLVTPLVAGQSVVIGIRKFGLTSLRPGYGFLTLLRTIILRLKFGRRAPARLGSVRAFRREVIANVNMASLSDGNAWSLDFALAALAESKGGPVEYVRLKYLPRLGLSKLSGNFFGSWTTGLDSLRVIGRHKSDYLR